VRTVEEMWATYARTIRPSAMPTGSDLFVFEQGITPTWEDPKNHSGGKFIIRTTKEGTNFIWEEVLMAALGNASECFDEVTGVVVSIRGKEDAVSLWIKDASKAETVCGALRGALGPCCSHTTLTGTEFKRHDTT